MMLAPDGLARGGDAYAASLSRFVRLAGESDSPRALVQAASSSLRRPVAVVDAAGARVAAAPAGDGSAVALSVAHSAALGAERTGGGWTVRRLAEGDLTLGWLAIGDGIDPAGHHDELVEALFELLRAQLHRSALRRAVLEDRRTVFRQRILMDSRLVSRDEAAGLGLELAQHYWPALVVGRLGTSASSVLAAVVRVWDERAPAGSFVVAWDGALVLLYALDAPGAADRGDVERTLGAVVEALTGAHSRLEAWGVLDERGVPLAKVAAQVRALLRLRHRSRAAASHAGVVDVRSLALDRFLERIGPDTAHGLVQQCIGPLIQHDDRHGTCLAQTLELALEHRRRDDAARAGYMHRNTLRRHLQQALELVDADLEDPDQRLALHLALKLHSVQRRPN